MPAKFRGAPFPEGLCAFAEVSGVDQRQLTLGFDGLNRFAFAEVHSDAVERWNFDDIRAWRKIEDKLTAAAQGGADSDV